MKALNIFFLFIFLGLFTYFPTHGKSHALCLYLPNWLLNKKWESQRDSFTISACVTYSDVTSHSAVPVTHNTLHHRWVSVLAYLFKYILLVILFYWHHVIKELSRSDSLCCNMNVSGMLPVGWLNCKYMYVQYNVWIGGCCTIYISKGKGVEILTTFPGLVSWLIK